jgi:hypothetical protein
LLSHPLDQHSRPCELIDIEEGVHGLRSPTERLHGLPKFRLMDHDISAGLFFPSMRFDRVEQSLGGQPRRLSYPSSPTSVQFRLDAQEAFRQPDFAGP